MSIKRRFPTEESLQESIKQRSADLSWKVKNALGHLEADYRKARMHIILATALLVAVYLIIQAAAESDLPLWAIILLIIGALSLIIPASKMGVSALKTIHHFNYELNKMIFPAVLRIFDLTGTWSESQYGKTNLHKLFSHSLQDSKNDNPAFDPAASQNHIAPLDQSLLITEPRNTVTIEDTLKIDFGGRQLLTQELSVKHITGSGKSRRVKNIFSGYFVSFELKTKLSDVTFVSTDGDRYGFGHESYWNSIKDTHADLRVTELEWNDFEDKLHVMTSSELEARYVLTPNFMADLYDWWKTKNQNIRIVFMNKQMYILFPSQKVKIGRTINKISDEEINDYVSSIATPLLHVFHLLETTAEHL